jgi:hypothetical protein
VGDRGRRMGGDKAPTHRERAPGQPRCADRLPQGVQRDAEAGRSQEGPLIRMPPRVEDVLPEPEARALLPGGGEHRRQRHGGQAPYRPPVRIPLLLGTQRAWKPRHERGRLPARALEARRRNVPVGRPPAQRERIIQVAEWSAGLEGEPRGAEDLLGGRERVFLGRRRPVEPERPGRCRLTDSLGGPARGPPMASGPPFSLREGSRSRA